MKTLANKNKRLVGEIEVPGDKSISHRSIMLGALANGVTNIYNFLESEDSTSTINAFRSLGVKVEQDQNVVRVFGKGTDSLTRSKNTLDMGNSGTTVRLISGILSALPLDTELIGDESLSRRPMKRIIEPLTKMGASIDSNNGTLPMTIKGKELQPIRYKLPIDSAQVKSAVLLAGLLTEGKTTVIEPNVTRDHTERMLPIFGASITRENIEISIEGIQSLKGADLYVPGDISSASFWVAGATIVPGSDLIIQSVGLNPTRTGFINVLKRMGARIETDITRYEGDEPIGDIRVRYTDNLSPTIIEENEIATMVDEIPILALVATQSNGEIEISHLEELRYKESNRVKTTVNTLKKLGAAIEETEDGMKVIGGQQLNGANINSFGDHRMAMMASIASLITDTPVKIDHADCIRVSYPRFFDELKRILN